MFSIHKSMTIIMKFMILMYTAIAKHTQPLPTRLILAGISIAVTQLKMLSQSIQTGILTVAHTAQTVTQSKIARLAFF